MHPFGTALFSRARSPGRDIILKGTSRYYVNQLLFECDIFAGHFNFLWAVTCLRPWYMTSSSYPHFLSRSSDGNAVVVLPNYTSTISFHASPFPLARPRPKAGGRVLKSSFFLCVCVCVFFSSSRYLHDQVFIWPQARSFVLWYFTTRE